MQITIASIDQKEKLSFITTTDGQKLRVWNDKAARFGGLEQSGTYEVETESGQYGTHITKAKKASGALQVTTSTRSPTKDFVQNASVCPPHSKDEQIFVQGVVQQLIRSGEVTLDNVEAAVNKMRGVWKRTLGRAVIQQQMEAAE
jgi:hypothetical protein